MRFVPVLVLTLFLGACSRSEDAAEAARVLRFTAIPDQNTTELIEKFQPVADYLARELGVEVEYVPATDYGASVEMFKNGQVHLAWFGGLTGVQARRAVPGAHAIAQGKEDPQYYSYFIAHESTGLERSDDFPMGIAALSFAFGSERSTSGRLMPEYFIRTFGGKPPKEFFQKPFGFSGSHDATAKLVQAGTYEAGALNYKVYDKLVAAGTIDPQICRVIWKTPTYADYNFTAHPDLETIFGKGFTRRLQTALVNMKDPKLLAAFPRSALIPATDEEFATIAEVAEQLGLIR